MPDDFAYDIFLSHSAKDKEVVRPLAERLRTDGVKVWFDEWVLKPGDSIPAKIAEGLERSRVLVLCMSANAFGSEWAQLESGTFRFRDPLNKERRFLPLHLDNAPIKGSLAQYLHVNWSPAFREQEYIKVLEGCKAPRIEEVEEQAVTRQHGADSLQVEGIFRITSTAFNWERSRVLIGDSENHIILLDLHGGGVLGKFRGNSGAVQSIAWAASGRQFLSATDDGTVRLWDIETRRCIQQFEDYKGYRPSSVAAIANPNLVVAGGQDGILRVWDMKYRWNAIRMPGHNARVWSIVITSDGNIAVSGSADGTIRIWDLASARCFRVLEGHTDDVTSVALSPDQRWLLSGGWDKMVRVWDLKTWKCVRAMSGHTESVTTVDWSSDSRLIISGSADKTVRVWDQETGRCGAVLEGHNDEIMAVTCKPRSNRAFSVDEHGAIKAWHLPRYISQPASTGSPKAATFEQIEYTNAKVLIVGDTHAGKTALAHRLATRKWRPSKDSTVGSWSTQWRLKDSRADPGVDREIWLWDFGGQADQRLIHQLYMDRSALILLLFDADQEDVLPGLRDWQTALRRCVKESIPHLLVAGRIDTGFKASRGKLQAFAKEQGLAYHETSAKSGDGCDELRGAVIDSIPWEQIEKRTSPRIFKLIKEEILKLRDEEQVLHTFKELRELLWRRLPDEPRFSDETLQTVIGLLDGPGVVKELEYGTYILLAPEWINRKQ